MVQKAIIITLVYWLFYVLDPYIMSWQCLNRPIVVAPIIGLVLGDMHTGIIMGASLEAIFMGISAIGGSIPADCLSATIIAVSSTILTGSDVEVGLALALPIGTLIAQFSAMFTPVWASFSAYWEKLAAKGDMRKFTIQNLLFTIFVMPLPVVIVMFFAVSYGVDGLNAALSAMPAWVMTGLGAASSMMVAVGFAILASMIWSNEVAIFFFVGYVLASYCKLESVPIAIIGTAIAITMFFGEKRYIDLKNNMAKEPVEASNSANDEEDFF